MSVAAPSFAFDTTYVRDLEGLFVPWQAAQTPAPRLLALNEQLARELGLDPDALRGPDGVAVLAGNAVPEGATPVAQAYAGHQFGNYSPRLGDGRALLLGEVLDIEGRRRDVHLKGSGRTPFARGGDGKAAVGPMLREYVIGEAMHALGIPTTRALAVVATGEDVARETMLPGAVLTRIAASHLRVGTFQYAAALGDRDLLRGLADYAIARHHPEAADAEQPYLAFFERVVDAQASLIAQWMLVGFIHGVMNTDNMTISGETIDYGPCAFMDALDPATVFSSIDQGARYAYGNQPHIAQWNLARLAEPLLPLLGDDTEAAVAAATAVLDGFPERYRKAWAAGMRAKLGLAATVEEGGAVGPSAEGGPGDAHAEAEAHAPDAPDPGAPGDAPDPDGRLMNDLLVLLRDQRVDWTSSFRALSASLRGDDDRLRAQFPEPEGIDAWTGRWRERLAEQGIDPQATAAAMDRVNPVYVPRNQVVEDALAAATAGDLGPFERLVDVLARPFEERPGLEAYAAPAPADFGASYRTFCGT